MEKNIEIKNWEDIPKEKKTQLLNHWFHYYGGVIMTLDEILAFSKLAEEKQDEIFDLIITNYVVNDTIQSNVLVASMRKGKVQELLDSVVKYSELSEEEKNKMKRLRQFIAEEIITTYNTPEPPVPMDIDVVVLKKENNGQDLKK